jgi:hypothetical protein
MRRRSPTLRTCCQGRLVSAYLLLLGETNVHVVVVISEWLNDVWRPGKSRVRANEDELRKSHPWALSTGAGGPS